MAHTPPGAQSKSTSPLDSPNYLISPLTTVLESVNDPQSEIITLHDLTEAYATLSRRIRLQAATISKSNDRIYPAFTPLQTNSHSLSLCLIQSISDDGMLIEGTERAQAYTTLSHHALVFLSDVFSFVPLANTLSVDDLSDLFREVLHVLLTPRLPTPSPNKTWSLAVWTLISQRLRLEIIQPHIRMLKKVVMRLVQGSFDVQSLQVDGLKLFSTLLRAHPSEFLNCLPHLFPHILALAVEDTVPVQLQTLSTLRSIVALKLDSPDTTWSRKLASQTHAFIKSQSTKLTISQSRSLRSTLTSAITGENSNWDHRGPLWALLLTACLICLSDASMFTHPHSVKLLVSILGQAANDKRTFVRALHPHIWICLVWCFSRLPKDTNTGSDLVDIRTRVFDLLKQELRSGIPTALVASILSSSSVTTSDIVCVLDLVKVLLSSSKESQIREGVGLLSRLLSSVGAPSAPSRHNDIRPLSDIVRRDLFVGPVLELPEAQIRALSTRLSGPDDRFVQPFTEDQIRENWKGLVELWVHAIRCTHVPVVRFKQYEDQLMNIWQFLLLVQSQLTSGSTLLSMSPSTAGQVTSTVVSFIANADDTTDQLRQLQLVQKLWSVIRRSYGAASLSSIAETLLSTVLSHTYTLSEIGVKDAWSALCGDFVSVGVPQLAHTLLGGSESQEGVEVQRQLWAVMAESGLFPKVDGHEWEDVLSFLILPIKHWSMDFHEVELWKTSFERLLETVTSSSGTPHDVVNALFRKLGEDIRLLKNNPRLIPFLLPNLHFNPNNLLHQDLLKIVSESLVRMYPPTPEDHTMALPILEGVARLVGSCEGETIVRLFALLQDGVCLWLRDEKKSLLEQEHTTLIQTIYCPSLITLSALPPKLSTLQTLSPFLSSSFERMNYPPIGPLAFEQFWRRTYHDLGNEELGQGGGDDEGKETKFDKRLIPDDLKICLRAWSDHCGDSLAEGLGGESQSTIRSIVPDSQSQSPDKTAGDFGFEGHVMMVEEEEEEIYHLVAPSSDPPPPFPDPLSPVPHVAQDERDSSRTSPIVEISHATAPKVSEVQKVAGQKRYNETPGDRPIRKRRRRDDESISRIEEASLSPVLGSLSKPRSLAVLDNLSSVRPVLFGGRAQQLEQPQAGPSSRTRRTIVPPSPPQPRPQPRSKGEAEAGGGVDLDFVPSTPSPAARRSGGNASRRRNMGYGHDDEDEIVDDSTEMDVVLTLGYARRGEEPPHSSKSSYKRLHSEPLMIDHQRHSYSPPSPSLHHHRQQQQQPSGSSNDHPRPPRPTPLRRNHTTSERLGALERAYSLVADPQGTSEVPIEELAHAAQLAHKIGAKIAEQMSKKFLT
ncbi:hypothetical protein AN958_08396 [Leucoagaricus sp. SymC.cos]|nr:hypothetical protein AN958_08396 [Leucoagaricus sp. SymC.cos]